jgi:hypothetical protein
MTARIIVTTNIVDPSAYVLTAADGSNKYYIEDGGSRFLRNVGNDDTSSYHNA